MTWVVRLIGIIGWVLWLSELMHALEFASQGNARGILDMVWIGGVSPAFAILIGTYITDDRVMVGPIAWLMATVMKVSLWDPFVAGFPGVF
ncbi:MAG: hypothetical protein KDA25_00040 [Phycisphaerales bacterium]|nr:hypothetical protein [Phycisphaerales bacterium]